MIGAAPILGLGGLAVLWGTYVFKVRTEQVAPGRRVRGDLELTPTTLAARGPEEPWAGVAPAS